MRIWRYLLCEKPPTKHRYLQPRIAGESSSIWQCFTISSSKGSNSEFQIVK